MFSIWVTGIGLNCTLSAWLGTEQLLLGIPNSFYDDFLQLNLN